jgi:hypothetical protein
MGIRLQGIDAPELHYKADTSGLSLTDEQRLSKIRVLRQHMS